MNNADLMWYRAIGFAETVISTASEKIALIEGYYDLTFDDIFISNIQNEGHEEYPSLWLFTEEDVVECKNFLNRFDIDIVKYRGKVYYVNTVLDKAGSLTNPEQTSQMKLVVLLTDNARCVFEAKGQNCERLHRIAKRFLKEYKERK